jgi:crotonobetainyl-CoA:carnitine CoA-transferase CaiB-like acyl-CoA transferase
LLGRSEYADGPSRVRNKLQLREDVAAVTGKFATADLIERLNAVGVPCGRVNDIGEAFEDSQVRHLQMTRTAHHPELGDLRLLRTPINLSEHPKQEDFHHAAPDPGQHTNEILAEIGCSDAEIEALRARGVIA